MSSISVKNLTIKFRSYRDTSPSLKDTFANFFMAKDHSPPANFSAIKNVSFDIKASERVGIIGHNGAGKSTLLKALCRVYEPTDGLISVSGRIAPLLEVGAGFHPDFTGRENIFLNGAILGYSKQEMLEIEHEVIDFAELQEFINTPVKYYSTGMYMRLAFSLATAMHPDILILDEIFSGGDAEYMIKAKSRMQSFINKANIVIMISHDLLLIKSLCNRVLWLDRGNLLMDGDPEKVIESYLAS